MSRPRTLPDTPATEKRRAEYKTYRSGREWARKKILALETEVAALKTKLDETNQIVTSIFEQKKKVHEFMQKRFEIAELAKAQLELLEKTPLRVVANKSIPLPDLESDLDCGCSSDFDMNSLGGVRYRYCPRHQKVPYSKRDLDWENIEPVPPLSAERMKEMLDSYPISEERQNAIDHGLPA